MPEMYGEQQDGSIVDIYGNKMSLDERLSIMEVYQNLPVSLMLEEIVRQVKDNIIVIIQGETGSGKTTQVPKELFKKLNKRVIVTQPRVISAISNASRVSQELLAETGNHRYSLGDMVGYRTGQGVSSKFTSPLSFHTDGLELMRQCVQGVYPEILTLDEVHNFAIATEILSMIIKYKKGIKIVIMSATLDPAIFQNYFSFISKDIPFIKVPGRTHEVKKYFNPLGNYREAIATHSAKGQNVLFFVPGKKEIQAEVAALKKMVPDVQVFPLHAEIPKEEQNLLMKNLDGVPRIIVATNVAEESITIPYVDVVYDLGTHKVARYNSLGIEELRLEDTSQANCLQRAGRAGRTKRGEYVRENDTLFSDLDKYPSAPIERQMIDRYILVLLAQGIDLINELRASRSEGKNLFLHKISSDLLSLSYERLEKVGAIDSRNRITSLGKSLLVFPLDVYQARMLYEGIERGCSEDMLYAAAIIERKGFLSKNVKWKKILSRRKIEGKTESDIFSYIELLKLITARKLPAARLRLFEGIIAEDVLHDFQHNNKEGLPLYEFIEDIESIGIKVKKVREISLLVEELKNRFETLNIELTNTGSLNDKKIALLSGNLHNIFEFVSDTKKFHNIDHKKGKSGIDFVAGDISVVNDYERSGFYTGVPFILGGVDGSPDINLITFLTRVEKAHRDELMLSQEKRRKITLDSTNKSTVWNLDDSIHSYTRGLERFQEGAFNADTFSSYFQDHLLVDYLIVKNKPIQKFLIGRNPNAVFAFRQLLKRHIKGLKRDTTHRIHKEMDKTDKSFIDDTSILDSFLGSKDAYVQKFLRGEDFVLDESVIQPDAELKISSNEEEVETNDQLFRLIESYRRLLSGTHLTSKKESIQKMRNLSIEKIQEDLMAVSPDYNSIVSIYQTLSSLHAEDIKRIAKELKISAKKEKKIDDMEKEKNRLISILELLTSSQLGKPTMEVRINPDKFRSIVKKLLKKSSGGARKAPTSGQQKSVNKVLFSSNMSAKGLKKAKSAIRFVYSKIIVDEIESLEKEIAKLKEITLFKHVDTASKLRESLSSIFSQLFSEEYFKMAIEPRLSDLVRTIVSSPISASGTVEEIIKKFFKKLSFRKISSSGYANIKTLFDQIDAYSEKFRDLEMYRTIFFEEVKTTKNEAVIQGRISELGNLIEELSKISGKIEKTKEQILKSTL